jgi:transketolase
LKEITPVSIRTWSMLGQRGSFGAALTECAGENPAIVALTADLCNTSGLDRFQEAYPERLFNVGIAEQNLVGVAAGLADSGYVPFATTFANFATLRACEWVRHFMGYMQCNVKLVGFGAGFAMEQFGNTHYGIEDVAAIRAIPNIRIFSPADGLEVVKCVVAAANEAQPAYIRLTGRMNNPIVHRKDFEFVPGKMIALRDGGDVGVFATGNMVHLALGACEALDEAGIRCALYDVHTISPLDETVMECCRGKKLAVSVEEHSVVGGLGSAIAERISESAASAPLLRLGIAQGYRPAGDYEYMLERNRLTKTMIAEDIKSKYLEVTTHDKP